MPKEILKDIIGSFTSEKLITFFRRKSTNFRQAREEYTDVSREQFRDVAKIGEIKFADTSESKLIVVTARVLKSLLERSGKKAQYDLGKKMLAAGYYDAGIFVFYDTQGSFRFSLIYPQYVGRKKQWSNFRRFTYFASPELANKTFINQIAHGDFSTLDKVKESFSLAKVTNDFYNEFKGQFEKLCGAVKVDHGKPDAGEVRDFTLLFVIRVIFIGFIQKRGWIGDDEKFLPNFLIEYAKKGFGRELFYNKWLEPFFFEALNSAPGTKVAYRINEFPEHIEKILQMAPYLNGGLFERRDLDGKSWFISDEAIRGFFDFLFSYNFTIEENTLFDEELELNPEFLGIIFERLVNKENGAVYTPRTEVDFMCRMALVKWLEKNNSTRIALKDLYELFFREGGPDALDDYQRRGDFTAAQKKDLIDLLETVTVCDPAAGSGAFLVGMLHVLDEVEQCLRGRVRDIDYKEEAFPRKQRVISRSLYGVEVKGWAVWITQLRLWITLFIDAPESMRSSFVPILPSLDFKVRQGDSLVQRIGKKMFPVAGHANIPKSAKIKVTQLKNLKAEFFHNKHKDLWEIKQTEYKIFRDILGTQIQENKNKLHDLLRGPEKQEELFDDNKQYQQSLELYKDRISDLKAEIDELHEEMQALREERPLIWNIEFAEIFFDKDKGGFDIIIGNPPYVRQEAIADPLGKIKNAKEYKDALAEMVRGDFPREFKKEKLNAQSDLYTYFYIRSLRLLNEKGVHVFICSNSWLDVGYGVWLQKFLLNYAPVHFIFDNHSKRSFAAADVNTIISVIGGPVKKVDKEHMVKFVAFKLPFEEVIFTENLLEIERVRTVAANEKFRVYPIIIEDLFKCGVEVDRDVPSIDLSGKYVGSKWGGKFLRAPDIFFEILKRGEPHLERLRKFFDGERYLNTGGADGFFILTKVEATNHHASIYNDKSLPVKGKNPFNEKIEAKYLVPLIKEIEKENKKIELSEADAWCLVVKNAEKRDKVFEYIRWGERQGYNKRSVTINQKPWYKPTVQMLSGGEVLLPRSFNDIFVVHYNPQRFLSLRFYRLHVKGSNTKQLVAFLNSTLFWFFYETLGQKNLGGGALDFFMEDFLNMEIPVILDTAMIPLLEKMKSRRIGNIFEECGLRKEENARDQEPRPLPDRKRLDDIIFDAIGLTIAERKDVYWSVCELVKNRLDKAGSV